jgi:hypothetical protein
MPPCDATHAAVSTAMHEAKKKRRKYLAGTGEGEKVR